MALKNNDIEIVLGTSSVLRTSRRKYPDLADLQFVQNKLDKVSEASENLKRALEIGLRATIAAEAKGQFRRNLSTKSKSRRQD